MKRFLLFSVLLTILSSASAQSSKDKPIGWVTCTSLDGGKTYDVTGGGNGKSIVLTSNGEDMREIIMDAIAKYDVIILDGSKGEFKVSKTMRLNDMKNKSIIGKNNARVKTAFTLTKEVRQMLDDLNIKNFSSIGTGTFYTLPNGSRVKEEREYKVREALINFLNDPKENYRDAGLFSLNNMENIIFRNITLVGPGAVDVGGSDLMTASHGTKHLWVDHCDFIDGMDGNFDINSFSDFITISWCIFEYTENAYDHMNTNLIGSNDNPQHNGIDNLNVTYANCIWGHGCDQRMPMVRFGNIHLLNCLYDCAGNSRAINPRRDSEVLVENCYFEANVVGPVVVNTAKAVNVKGCIFNGEKPDSDIGTVKMPYKYKAVPAKKVPAMLKAKNGAGATLNL